MKKYLLKDLFELRKERVPAGKFLIINGDDFYSNSPYFLKNYRYGNFPNEKLKKTGYNGFFRKGDILLLTIGAKKKIWLANQDGVCASGNNKIKIITAKQRETFTEYLIYLLISNNITNWLKATLAGSVIPQVLWLPFVQKEVFILSPEEQKKVIYNLANLRKYRAKIEQLSQKIEQLALLLARKLSLNRQLVRKKLRELAIVFRGKDLASTSQFNAPHRFYTCSPKKRFSTASPYSPPAIIFASSWDPYSQKEYLLTLSFFSFNASNNTFIIKPKNQEKVISSIFCSLKLEKSRLGSYFCASIATKRLNPILLTNFSVTIFPSKEELIFQKFLYLTNFLEKLNDRIELLTFHLREQIENKTNQFLHPFLI